jgi:hypothetical protein
MKKLLHIFLWSVQKHKKFGSEVLKFLKIDSKWNFSSIEENLKHWFLQFPKLRHIPFLVFWGIWKFRNKILFENWNRMDQMIVINIILSLFHCQRG